MADAGNPNEKSRMTPCILVASDGAEGAAGALRTAYLLAQREGVRVEVLAVCPPMELYPVGTPEVVASFPAHVMAGAAEALRARVEAQLAEIGGGAELWPVTIETGGVAAIVARIAAKVGADLILLGLRPHPRVERWLARETLLRVIHLSSAPVLAVPPEARELPGRIVIATDFTEFSERVKAVAIRVSAEDALVHLVHVTWAPSADGGWADTQSWVQTYRLGVEQRLTELAAELAASSGRKTHVRVLAGEPAPELLRFASEVDAELLAAGSHGSGFLGRMVMGSVSSRLVHGARCGLLVAPPEAAPVRVDPVITEREMLSDPGPSRAEYAERDQDDRLP
jgi:nucleotide-binding universal stress UspA family protein